MTPLLRTWLIGSVAAIVAIWVGVSLAQEKHFIASVAALFSVWAVLAWTRGPLAESWLLGFLAFGYVIGNRGFAQIAPIAGLPLFLSELGLAVTVALVILRGALNREVPIRLDWLTGLLLFWFVLGVGRMLWDIRVYGILALRDFATVYYVLYFFAALALARHDASRRLLHGTLLVTFALLPFTSLLSDLFSEFFLSNLLVAGVPLIYYKEDLLATFLFAGFIFLVPKGSGLQLALWWRWILAAASLYIGFAQLSRAAILGLVVALTALAWARIWQPVRVVVVAGFAGALLIFVHSLVGDKDFTQTKVYALYEHVASIADLQGSAHYRNIESSDSGDNNRFRLIWWRNVTEETLTSSPVFGLGFGADLARGFVQEYYPTEGGEFNTRSPHNVFVTLLGRMGLIGVIVFLAFYITQFRVTLRTARAARADPAQQDAITLQAACWVVMVSACFGVVLEGPMGAIPFWIMLGLAHHEATRVDT
jgi:O-antigen ligase